MKLAKPFGVVLILAFLFLIVSKNVAYADSILYAKPVATGTADCSSWNNACSLQTALGSAVSGDEIWVMEGTHTPGTLRTDTFQLVSNVAIYGGFSGIETTREERDPDPATNNTTLSGEIGTASPTDNIFHVVTGADDATLDGFTITEGHADTYPNDNGGGMYNNSSSPTLTNIIFYNNSAGNYGGGMYNYFESSPILTNVIFDSNWADNGGGIYNTDDYESVLTNVTFSLNYAFSYGGGMYNYFSYPEMTNVTFDKNWAEFGGGMSNFYGKPSITDATFSENYASDSCGGMSNYNSSPIITNVIFSKNESAEDSGGMCNVSGSDVALTNVTFSENLAGLNGGGMSNLGSDSQLTNVTFSKNSAEYSGGGIYMIGDGVLNLENVTFSENSAKQNGGGMNNYGSEVSLDYVTFSGNDATISGGGLYNELTNLTMTNVILWGNTAATGNEIFNNSSAPVISDSVIEGGYPDGTNIITDDPLLDTLTDYGGAGMQVFPLGDGSSAMDAADETSCPEKDQRGLTRPQGDRCDIGSFEKGPPSNDDISSPTEITALGNQDALNTSLATSAIDDPALPDECGVNGQGQATVWYTYLATSDTAISLDTFNADYDTFIAVWTGTYPSLNLVACNNDASGTQQSQVAFLVTNNTTYYIEIGQP